MKQVIQNFRSGVLKIDDVPPPMLRDGGLLVMNHVSLISPGTEKSTVQVAQKSLLGKAMERPEMVKKVLTAIQKDGLKDTLQRVFERLDTPAALGYSCAGTVAAVGADASQFSVGDRVACAGQNYASHAEVVYVPKNLCVKLPTTVDFEDAACVTLGAIALQGVRQAEPRLGDRIAVIGLGLLGQLTVQMLKAAGCRVLGSDLDGTKLDLARQLGADLTVRPSGLMDAATGFSEGHGVDAVIITASTKDNSPVEIAGAIARKKGRVVVVGAVGMNLPREPYYKKELDFKLSMSYGPGRYDSAYEEKGQDYPYSYVRWTENRNMAAFLDLVGDGKVQLKPLITHRFEISKADDAYRMMTEGQTPYMGMLITYPLDQQQALQPSITVVSDKPTGRLTLGLIGVGNHVKDMLLPQLQSQAAVSIRAVCTASGINAKALGEKLHAGYCTSDSQDVLRDPAINTVLIGTRHDTHGRLVVKALEADKHVFVEKPLCLTEEELDAIHAVYRDKAAKGLRLMVGFNRRFSPHAEKAREFFAHRENPLVMWYRINAGKIPAEHWIQDPSVGGGRLIGEACHFVDYMQSVCGARPNSVFARRIGRQSSGITDDQCIITLTFEDGSIGSIIYTAGGNSGLAKERFEAHADGKSLTMDDFEETHLYSGSHREVFKTSKRDKGFKTEIAHFVQTVEQGIPCVMSFGEIAAVTRACLLAVRSLQSGSAHDIAYV
ncbi:MAG TPA: bi-domain-containing oxidoreductase [Nitrospira sp.]|nr:bi-domain-containing oxidoreductase [Nitrospira sp.]